MSEVTIPFGNNGKITGVAIDSSVNRYVGIPFAVPPTGDRRWKKPEPLPFDFFDSETPYDATNFKDLCLQPPSPLPYDASHHPTVFVLRN